MFHELELVTFCGYGTGTVQEPKGRDHPPLETGIRALLEGEQTEKAQCVYSEMAIVDNRVRL
jgi:hypothetical protein